MPLVQHRLLIDGRHVDAASGRSFETIDPATEQPIAAVAEADAEDIDIAVAAARRALSGPWGHMRAADRGRILHTLANLIELHSNEIAALESRDAGKPIAAVLRQDLPAAIDTLRYYAGWADKINGQVVPARPVGAVPGGVGCHDRHSRRNDVTGPPAVGPAPVRRVAPITPTFLGAVAGARVDALGRGVSARRTVLLAGCRGARVFGGAAGSVSRGGAPRAA